MKEKGDQVSGLLYPKLSELLYKCGYNCYYLINCHVLSPKIKVVVNVTTFSYVINTISFTISNNVMLGLNSVSDTFLKFTLIIYALVADISTST